MATPPYRIESARLVLRCYEPRDAPLLADAVNSSLDHLAPWMPWAAPTTVEDEVQLLRRFRSQFDRDENYVYGVFTPDETRIVGGGGLHPRSDPGSLEIGYWIAGDVLRRGYATEVAAVLTRVAFDRGGLDRVDIQVDQKNERSQGIPRKLGFTHEGTLRRRLERRAGEQRGDSMMFTMLREEYERAPWRESYPYRAYDVLGRGL
ncbi:MAG TPA: GNAT family protein [Gaiellaceae bacterium]|nr:GNAT family protein [Gaiellaceae bacterium]